MEETPAGLLEARVDAEACVLCGLCARVCPGARLEDGLFADDTDPLKGTVLAAFTGVTPDGGVRRAAQSGGVATALLLHLLRIGQIDGALVTEMPQDGSLRPAVRLAGNSAEVIGAQGSKYCPVSLNAFLAAREETKIGRLAAVGVSCHVHGLRNAAAALPEADVRPFVLLGLFCDRVLAGAAIDYLIGASGVPRRDVTTFRYKSKERRGWPGDVRIEQKNGRITWVDGDKRLACKDRFTPARCRLCFDKFNVLADISLGDAWGVREEYEGVSAVLVRTERGMEVIQSARQAGAVQLEEVDPEAIFRGNDLERRRRAWTAYTKAWMQMERLAPDLGIPDRAVADIRHLRLVPHRRLLKESLRLRMARSRRQVVRRARRTALCEQLRRRAKREAKKLLRR